MVATKRTPQAEVINAKEKRSGNTDLGSISQEPLGGFIFVCNNETMGEDFERHLFGLPQKYHDSVKAIQPGLPLFLYNYSTRCLHGVFEASSDGGLNIEPDAWGENKEARKNGRQSLSRFPAQVRVRWREERPPLDEEKFRPVLYHYDGPKFRLQLSQSEAEDLLKLFGASPNKIVDEPPQQEDTGGEWEKVKTKSKARPAFRTPSSKGSTSPNAISGRRRGANQNGQGSNGVVSLSSFNNSGHEIINRGRDREIRVDSAQRWRSDSDSWSGSSSAGTVTSSWGSHEEERPKRGLKENGCVADTNGVGGLVHSEGHDSVEGIASSKGFANTNGSIDNDHKVEIRFIVDSNESNSSSSANSLEFGLNSHASARSGFVSYRAALKSGMLPGAALENGFGDSNGPSSSEAATSPPSSVGNGSTRTSYSNVAGATCVPPLSPKTNIKGDPSGDRIEGLRHTLEPFSIKIGSYTDVGLTPTNGKSGPHSSIEKGSQEINVDHLANGDGNGRRAEKMQPWVKAVTVKTTLPEVMNAQLPVVPESQKSSLKVAGDPYSTVKKAGKEGVRTGMVEDDNGDLGAHQRFGTFEAKENSSKISETAVRKNVWQGNEGAVLRLLHDPDPAVNSSMDGGTLGVRVEGDMYRGKHDKNLSPQPQIQQVPMHPPMERVVYVQSPSVDGQQNQWSDQAPSSSVALPPHVSQMKATQHQLPLFQHNRSVHESRRQQFDSQKHEKHIDDRPNFRKQQTHSQEHAQHPASMLRPTGQGLMPLRIPTPPPSGMQHHHHHPLLSPVPQAPMYRSRSRTGSGNGNIENAHGLAYRPISRNMMDGEMAMQSPGVAGGWGLQSPVLLMQPLLSPITGNLTFPLPPPYVLGNVEALHGEILEFAQAARPSAETRVHAEMAVECVRDGVKRLWPEADVEVFGSFATGLCLQHSDVDVVVVDAPTPPDTLEFTGLTGARLLTPLIRALSVALKDYEWCDGLNTIETASMPVIKLRCIPMTAEGPSPGSPVAIDITIGGKRSEHFAGVSQGHSRKEGTKSKPVNPNFEAARSAHNGAAAREFVIEKLRQLPALAPLVLLLKSFLQQRCLNDVYSGGLGSFALTLMLVFYLERVPISCGIPLDIPAPTTIKKSTSSANLEAGPLSVDMSQTSSMVSESVDSSDDDSSDSSVLTSTSASSIASLEVPSVQGSSYSADEASSQAGPSHGELLLRRAGGIVEELLASMQSVSSPNLGTLLVGFLHVFGQEIDFSRVRLVLKGKNGSAGGVFWHEKNARTLPLWIDDPLRPDAIIGAGSFNIWQVQAAMREMLFSITRPQSVPGTPVPGVPSESGDRVGKGPGRRRPLPLLDQIFMNSTSPSP